MARLFSRHPGALARTIEITERCRFDLSQIRYQYPAEVEDPALSPQQALDRSTWDGRRRPATPPASPRPSPGNCTTNWR